MIYDCFAFFNELDVLDIRLNELNDIVDRFVLVESNTTYSGRPKEYNFENNKHLFEKFLPKIEYIKIDSPCKIGINMSSSNFDDFNRDAWVNENDQRNSCMFGLSEAKDNDIIMISDLDEIPNKHCLPKVFNELDNEPIVLVQEFIYYYLNCGIIFEGTNKIAPWYGTVVIKWQDLMNTLPQILRNTIHSLKRFESEHAGWHYSFMGGPDKIKQKIESFAHVEYNSENFLNIEKITKAINNGIDVLDRKEYTYKFSNLNDIIIPDYVRNNLEKFGHMIHA
jgi:beta-1,4-mannosyl-glycoprotein beta-1,4-N-acetylglucosaminyltransferase